MNRRRPQDRRGNLCRKIQNGRRNAAETGSGGCSRADELNRKRVRRGQKQRRIIKCKKN